MDEKEPLIIIEKPLTDSKKTVLVIAILDLLLKEDLSLNQINDLLSLVQKEAYKIPITVMCNKSD